MFWSDQVTTFAVFSLSFQAVVLRTKTAINHRFFNLVCDEWIDHIKLSSYFLIAQ